MFAAILLVAISADDPKVPANVTVLLKNIDKRRRVRVKMHMAENSKLKRKAKSAKGDRKKQLIDQASYHFKEAKRIREGGIYAPLLDPHKMKIGDIGQIHYYMGVQAVQVIDKKNALVQCYKTVFYFTDGDTKGWLDGENIQLPPIEVLGTKTYRTSNGGSNTVLELRPFDLSKYDKKSKK